jgi:maltose alpha-D-glucosyltransferase / alpha-amylase
VTFPTITADPYPLTLAPYSFIWLELQTVGPEEEPTRELAPELIEAAAVEEPLAIQVGTASWSEFLTAAGASLMEPALRDWLPRKRWFGAKTRTIESVHVRSWAELPPPTGSDGKPKTGPGLFFFEIQFFEGPRDIYQIPLAISFGAELESVSLSSPESVILRFTSAAGPAILHDAVAREDLHQGLLKLIAGNTTLPLAELTASPQAPNARAETPQQTRSERKPDNPAATSPAPLSTQPGEAAPSVKSADVTAHQVFRPGDTLSARASAAFSAAGVNRLPSVVASAEQSNTSILFGRQLFLKLYRRLQPVENPDVEVGRFLTEKAGFTRIPPFLGEISTNMEGIGKTTIGMLQGLVENDGDGWHWFLDILTGWLEGTSKVPAPAALPSPNWQSEPLTHPALGPVEETLAAASLLGRRTAELHLALASNPSDPAFSPEPLTRRDLERDVQRIEAQIKASLEALKMMLPKLEDPLSDRAGLLLSRRAELLQRARSILNISSPGQVTRIHGDYHLGQVLHVEAQGKSTQEPQSAIGDFVLIDFEGEPARPIEERRRKQCPLKDVAGMIRSFSYAAYTAIDRVTSAGAVNETATAPGFLSDWAVLWQNAATSAFLASYRKNMAAVPSILPRPADAQILLDAYLLDKALYELLYELDNRPAWVRIPINGILVL